MPISRMIGVVYLHRNRSKEEDLLREAAAAGRISNPTSKHAAVEQHIYINENHCPCAFTQSQNYLLPARLMPQKQPLMLYGVQQLTLCVNEHILAPNRAGYLFFQLPWNPPI